MKKVFNSVAVFLGTSTLLFFTPVSFGQNLESATILSGSIALAEPAQIDLVLTKIGEQRVNCGLVVDFGDGKHRDIRLGQENGDKDLNYRISQTYDRPGQYVIQIEPKFVMRGLNSASACQGETKRVVVTVRDPAEDKKKQEEELERIKAEAELAAKEQAKKEYLIELEKAKKEAKKSVPAAAAPSKSSPVKDAF